MVDITSSWMNWIRQEIRELVQTVCQFYNKSLLMDHVLDFSEDSLLLCIYVRLIL